MDQTKNLRAYQAPEITQLGSVESLTQGPWGGYLDGLFGSVGGINPFDGGGSGGVGETS